MATRPDPSRGRRARWTNVILIVVALALFALALWTNRQELRNIFARQVDWQWFVIGLAIYLVGLLVTFYRWLLLVTALGLPIRFRDAVRFGFIGNLFNLVIPGAVGGDVIKAAFVCRELGGQKTFAISSIVLDRIVGLLGLFLLGGISGAVAWSAADVEVRSLVALIWMMILGVIAVMVVAFTPAFYRTLNKLVGSRKKLRDVALELETMGQIYRRRIGTVVAATALAMVNHSFNVIGFFLVGWALYDQVPSLVDHYIIVPLVLFTTAVPLPFGALGVSEQAGAALFQLVDYPGGGVSMMGFRILMYGSGVVSVIVYLINLGQVRSLEAYAEQMEDKPENPVNGVDNPNQPIGNEPAIQRVRSADQPDHSNP